MQLQDNKKTRQRIRPLWFIGGLVIALIALLGADYLNNRAVRANLQGIACDAEQIEGDFFVNDKGQKFTGAAYKSTIESRSGSQSCRLTQKGKRGLEFQLPNPAPGNRYKVSVWRYATAAHQGFLVAEGTVGEQQVFYEQEGTASKEENGWELLQIIFEIPNEKLTSVKVYALIDEKSGDVFFDDLQLINLERVQATDAELFSPDRLEIDIDKPDYKKLTAQKWQGYKDGILLIEESERWVKAKINSEQQGEELKTKLRLKGDWLDHVSGDKWSFRIKVKDPQTWNRLVTFSVQHPKTRSYLEEWMYHQLLMREQVLTPRYDFIKVDVNGTPRGIYAYEEHFEKQLPESQKRREGPILKMTEDLMWLSFQREFTYLKKGEQLADKEKNAFEQADIRPFKESKTQANPTLNQQFEVAQSLLHQFKYNLQPASEIFDIKKLAKYYAINDLMYAYHGLTWHNQRFYFNPVINKLEPIGFDGFGDHPTSYGTEPFIGYKVKKEQHPARFFTYLFKDEIFFSEYLTQLQRLTSPTYLQTFLLDIEPALREREAFLQEEFTDYQYKTDKIVRRARELRTLLKPHDTHSLHARLQNKEGEEWELKIANRHALPLQVVGYGKEGDKPQKNLESPVFTFAQPAGEIPKWYDLKVPAQSELIYYQLPGIDTLYQSNIVDWKVPKEFTISQEEFKFKDLNSSDLYEIIEGKVLFKKGDYILKKDLLIPENYTVHFAAGVHIDLQNNAAFISKSPVYMQGTADDPIRIFSSDGTANAFTVLQAEQRSELQFVQFDGLNTLNKNQWMLTGAVTFYESDVDFKNCSFVRNSCEDGLNLVRCDFNLERSHIADTFGDGFDADFCKGTLREVNFVNTGNDAIDFSTSVISIENLNVQNAGDKGISVGEAATVNVKSATINGAVIGVAAKDLSQLTIENITLRKCTQGFAAYQKKPEFGAASITVKNFQTADLQHLYQLDKGSRLQLKDKIYEGE